jgi:hypothetical protein
VVSGLVALEQVVFERVAPEQVVFERVAPEQVTPEQVVLEHHNFDAPVQAHIKIAVQCHFWKATRH